MRSLTFILSVTVLLGFCSPLAAQSDPDSSLVVTAVLSPDPAPVGASIAVLATVTNTGTKAASFGHDGCPVRYEIDGSFTPHWGCAEFWRIITLEPGESFSFPEPNGLPLVHEPDHFPLSPGLHEFDIEVGSAGKTTESLLVTYDDSTKALAAGQVREFDGRGRHGLEVYLHPTGDIASDAFLYVTTTGDQGYFLFQDIQPGEYLLSTFADGQQVWFPGTPNPDRATPVTLYGYEDNLIIQLGDDPPPPPGSFVGTVTALDASGQPAPVPGAYVTAVRVHGDPSDSVYTRPKPEDAPLSVFTAYTDELGEFVLRVPGGMYKLFAGSFSYHDYAYWDGAKTWLQSEAIGPYLRRTYPFTLTDQSSASGAFCGTVMGFHPYHDGPPEPLPGTRVEAIPLGPLPYEVLLATQTDEFGQYCLRVFPGTPYRLLFDNNQYYPQYYDNAPTLEEAQGLDLQPGQQVAPIDAILHPRTGAGTGSIRGRILGNYSQCAGPLPCIFPLAGAIVRVNPAYPTFAPDERIAVTDSAGYFEVHNLAGDEQGSLSYYVKAEARGFQEGYAPGGVPYYLAEPVPVFPLQTSNAGDIVLPQSGTGLPGVITGQVRDPAGQPVAGATVLLHPHHGPLDAPTSFVDVSPIHTLTNDQGMFSVSNLPDRPYLIAVSREGFIPGYLGDQGTVHRWQSARAVWPGTAADLGFLTMTLRRQQGSGPYIQAGRVTRIPIYTAGLAMSPSTPREFALFNHHHNLGDAFFYLVSSEATGYGEFVVAGGRTGDNGTVVLTGLPAGTYYAYADYPGYETRYFSYEGGAIVPLFLSPTTPAVFAEIELSPYFGFGEEPPPAIHTLLSKPNPAFLGAPTSLLFDLEEPQRVDIQIFNSQGRLVRTVAEDLFLVPGSHAVPWDTRNRDGALVASGVYFYRVSSGSISQSAKVVILP